MAEKENPHFLGRALFLGILQIVLVVVLLGRMYYLQIFEGPYYHLLAEGNRVATRPLLPSRGQLYDRNKILLARNEPSFRAVLLTDKKDEIEGILNTFSTLIPLSPEEKEDILGKAKKKRGLDTLILKDNLSWEEVSVLELHAPDLPGISVEVGSLREYPGKLEGAHLLGYVSAPSEVEQENDSMLTLSGLKVGKVGIEKFYDSRLRGVPGHSAFEVNAMRKIVRQLDQRASIPGEDIHLSIDARLQSYVHEVLSAYHSASAVVIDIKTGEILALVSVPSFDPNLFPQGISHKDWDELRDNPYVPLTNKALSGLYPPGSPVKLLVALAALSAGVIDKDTTVHCPGYMYVGNHKFHCYRKEGHGTVNVSRAIYESCDVFFYEAAKKAGIDRLAAVYQDFGIGAGGLEGFPHAKKGLVPTKAWKLEKKKTKWNVSDTVMTSIGQGYMLATPLELALVTARLAAKGRRINPSLEQAGTETFPDMGYKQSHLDLILTAMGETANTPTGTAFRGRIEEAGLEMGGKTGTCQVRRISLQDRKAGLTKTHHLAWKYREHGIFVGFAPVGSPRYAIAVVIEHAGGAFPAVLAARDILLKAQHLEKQRYFTSPLVGEVARRAGEGGLGQH